MSILTPNRYSNINIIYFDNNNNNLYRNSQRLSMDSTRENNKEKNRNLKRLIHSQTFDNILKKETNWPKGISDYEYTKKHLEWGKNPPVHYITKQYITSAERVFNPITQKYTDKKFEEQLKLQEKNDITNSIAKGYDNELKKTQIYNIINLEDKLKGLEKNQGYPNNIIQKRKKFFQITPKINYNLLSNLNYKIHHFDKPEKRPDNKDNIQDNVIDFYNNGGKQRQKIIIARTLKDFNVITNEYTHYNKEKNETDLKFQNMKAAKNFYILRNKNPITGVYYDEDKEKKYQEQKELNVQKLLNKKKEGLYNPFNCIVYDEEGLKAKEKMIENKKLRYKERAKIEKYYHEKDLKNQDKYTNILKNKLLYDRFKEIEKRRFDIINNKESLELNKYDKICNKKSPWEIIKEGSNENENISKNQLTISRDKDDIEKKYIEAKIKKIEEIKKLPRIGSDPFFKINNNKNKINLSENNQKKLLSNQNSFSMDKKEWFSKNKDVN